MNINIDKAKLGKMLWVDVYSSTIKSCRLSHSNDALNEKAKIEADKALKNYHDVFGGYGIELSRIEQSKKLNKI